MVVVEGDNKNVLVVVVVEGRRCSCGGTIIGKQWVVEVVRVESERQKCGCGGGGEGRQ